MMNLSRTTKRLWIRKAGALLFAAMLPAVAVTSAHAAGFGIGGSGFIQQDHSGSTPKRPAISGAHSTSTHSADKTKKSGKPGYVDSKYNQYVQHTKLLESWLDALSPKPVNYEVAVDAPASFNAAYHRTYNILMLGKQYDVTVTGMNLGHSHVKWDGAVQSSKYVGKGDMRHPEMVPMKFTPKISYFKREKNKWVAHARVRVPKARRGERLSEGAIAPTIVTPVPGDIYLPEKQAYPLSIPFVVSGPVITHVELMGGSYRHKKYHPRSGGIDLFTGSASVKLFAKLTGRPMPVSLPSSFIKVRQSPRHALKSIQRTGIMTPAGSRPGTVKIRAAMLKHDALKAGVLMNKASLHSDPLTVTINRPYLIKENQFVFRLAIEGPANMSKYRTKWHFYQSGNHIIKHGNFIGNASQVHVMKRRDSANSPLKSARFEYVEIINKHNETVASLRGASMTVAAPDITLTVNGGSFTQSVPQIITANITGLSDEIAARIIVKWSFSGIKPVSTGAAAAERIIYGSDYYLMESEPSTDISYLKKTSAGQYISKMPVMYPENVDTAGKRPVIKAEIILKASVVKGGMK